MLLINVVALYGYRCCLDKLNCSFFEVYDEMFLTSLVADMNNYQVILTHLVVILNSKSR
jgi:hypothetical protein